jgi:hypothetical protein
VLYINNDSKDPVGEPNDSGALASQVCLSNRDPPVEHARAHPAGSRGPPTAVPAPIFLPVVRSATGTPTSELRILQGPALSHCGGVRTQNRPGVTLEGRAGHWHPRLRCPQQRPGLGGHSKSGPRLNGPWMTSLRSGRRCCVSDSATATGSATGSHGARHRSSRSVARAHRPGQSL